MRTAILALALGTFLAACSSDAVHTYTDAQSGARVELASGDRLELELFSNPSTGYGWVLSDMTNVPGLRLDESRYEEPDEPIPGAPGTEVFTFTAIDAGAGILRLEYVRSFEDPAIPERVVEYVVVVGDAVWPPD